MADAAQSIGEEARAYAELADRGVLRIAGKDRGAFLQGLVSNDINKVGPDRAIYAALLSAQGKYLHDFFIVEIGGALFLDAEAARLNDLKRRLLLYKLRATVEIVDASEQFVVAALFGDDALSACGLPPQPGAAKRLGNGALYVDPRLAALGARLMLPRGEPLSITAFSKSDSTAYDRLRLSLGVPDGSRDLAVDKAILLEAGFDELNGVDWQKGCYVGQELTARTKYRGLIKKRLVPVAIEGAMPAPGSPVMLGTRDAGEMRSGRDGIGIALLRLEALDESLSTGEPLIAGETRLRPRKPDWASF
ncbi:MAG TPA: folate-binding protein [Stellaceae bacterium]|nr:folate-binding protein [Stellaceae bacterium]